MAEKEHRQIARDSLFLMADLRLDGQDGEHRVKVRNLSAGGMMAEGTVGAGQGVLVDVNIRNIGWVAGAVAWVQDNRFGIAFSRDIDPKLVRLPVTRATPVPRYLKPIVAPQRGSRPLRKV